MVEPDELLTAARALAAEFGSVELLINNAGIGTIGPVVDSTPEAEINQVRVNVEAVIDLTTRAVQQMVPRGRGAISVYAKGEDYHEVIKPRLKDIARWLVAEAGVVGQLVLALADILGRQQDRVVVVQRVHDHVGRQFARDPVADLVTRLGRLGFRDPGDVGHEGALVAVDLVQLGLIGVGPFLQDRLVKGGPVFLHMRPFHGVILFLGDLRRVRDRTKKDDAGSRPSISSPASRPRPTTRCRA